MRELSASWRDAMHADESGERQTYGKEPAFLLGTSAELLLCGSLQIQEILDVSP